MLELEEPTDKQSHKLAARHTFSSSTRALRALLPVGMAIDILEHVGIKVFADQCGVQCCLAKSQYPTRQLYLLKQPHPHVMQLMDVNESRVHCKTLELALSFHEEMIQHSFHEPKKALRMAFG